MPWEKQFDVDEARERAMATFWARGYKATSMQDLLDAMGIQRGSFYGTFGSKHEILLESLRRYDDDRIRAFAGFRRAGSARRIVDAVLAHVAEGAGARPGPRGCFLVSSASELAPEDPEVAALVNRAFADTESFFRTVIEDGKSRLELDSGLDSAAVARALLGLLLGMQVLARAGADRGILAAIAGQARTLLGPPPASRDAPRKERRPRTTK